MIDTRQTRWRFHFLSCPHHQKTAKMTFKAFLSQAIVIKQHNVINIVSPNTVESPK